MNGRLEAALAAIQRVEEILYRHEDAAWGRSPETQEIRDAIADIDTTTGVPETLLGEAPPIGTYVLSTRRPADAGRLEICGESTEITVASVRPWTPAERDAWHRGEGSPRPGVVSGGS